MLKPFRLATSNARLGILYGSCSRNPNSTLLSPSNARLFAPSTRSLCSPTTLATSPGHFSTLRNYELQRTAAPAISTRCFSSSDQENGELKLVYVHPLSQLVLEVLQSDYSDWLVRRDLHRNSLTFHRDGTFEIKSPTQQSPPPEASASSPEDDTSCNSAAATAAISASANPKPEQQRNEMLGNTSNEPRIWTSFDETEKKHWLTVQRGKLIGRYMLQDNLMSAWQSNRKGSLPLRIQQAVNEMVGAIEKFEATPASKR